MTNVAIEVDALHKSFGNHHVLKGLTFNVPTESVFGFLGNNGVGKSTTVRLLLGLLKANSGTIRVLGNEIPKQKVSTLEDIGSIIDSPSLYYNLTGREYLRCVSTLKRLEKRDVEESISLVNMTKNIDRRISQYSLGMKQRLALANALMGMPKLLILDEPTNGLDPSGMKEIRNLLKALPEEFGTTVFLSSHLLDEVEKTATHIGLVNDGVMMKEGPIASFTGSKGALRVSCRPTDPALKVLSKAGFSAKATETDAIVVSNLDRDTAPQVHASLSAASIDIFESHFEKTNLEQMFLSVAETGERP